MKLDLNTLDVESFPTLAPTFSKSEGYESLDPCWTPGTDSEVYICIQTGNTVPSCRDYQCGVQGEIIG